jgi:hypothetical protein
MSDQLVAETSTWQHSQQTDIHAPGGTQTHNLSRRVATDPQLRLRSHWDRPKPDVVKQIITFMIQLRCYGYENIYNNLYPIGVGT